MTGLNLDATQLDRYSRHIIMDDVGPEGQRRLMASDVLVIGAGGLGTPVIQYLGAAGVGRIGIADPDVVERSNLQRQVIYRDDDVGDKKVTSARSYLEERNPDVTIDTYAVRVGPNNIDELIGSYDFIVDATDNFRSRYLINDACSLRGKPFSHAAIFRFEGQVSTFVGTADSPCYRCVFREAPPEGMIPDCAEAGVLGVLPGLMGCIQATETTKFLLETGEPLSGRLIFVDAKTMAFDEIQIRKDPDCPVCSEEAAIESIHDIEYTQTCAIPAD